MNAYEQNTNQSTFLKRWNALDNLLIMQEKTPELFQTFLNDKYSKISQQERLEVESHFPNSALNDPAYCQALWRDVLICAYLDEIACETPERPLPLA